MTFVQYRWSTRPAKTVFEALHADAMWRIEWRVVGQDRVWKHVQAMTQNECFDLMQMNVFAGGRANEVLMVDLNLDPDGHGLAENAQTAYKAELAAEALRTT